MHTYAAIAFLAISLVFFLVGALRETRTTSSLVTARQTGGFFLWQGIDSWINYAVYPWTIGMLGFVNGTSVMILLTLVQNISYVVVNNNTEVDWSFMSWITYLRDSDSHIWPLRYIRAINACRANRFRKPLVATLTLVRRVFRARLCGRRLANPIGFVYLSVWRDSFYAINFLYHKKADLRKPAVAGLFMVSHLLCNVAWAPIACLMAACAKLILNAITTAH